MIDFSQYVEQVKSKFKKSATKEFELIESFDKLKLASLGSNDTEGYQVFTPKFVVEQMVKSIGEDILDFSKNILEPTSGDGAFTTYILTKRLETIKDKNRFETESLKALSTIYSIEMDNTLIAKQRNNIFTVICNSIKKNKIDVDPSYYEIVKCIIITNFIWAMFNSEHPIGGFFIDVAYKMPDAEKKSYKTLKFPVWKISDTEISMREEEVEVC